MASPRGRALLWAAVTLCAVAPAAANAQIADTTQVPVDSVIVTPGARPVLISDAPDTTPGPMTPRGAFIRSMIVPGWGQAAFDRPVRGGVYFAGWAANWFMIFRNQVRLDDARSRFDRRVDQIEVQLVAESPNPDSLQAVLDSVPSVLEAAVRADRGPGEHGEQPPQAGPRPRAAA